MNIYKSVNMETRKYINIDTRNYINTKLLNI